MTKNEIVARWMGYKHISSELSTTDNLLYEVVPEFDESYDLIMKPWVKFRDLKFETTGSTHNDYDRKVTFNVFCSNICNAITHGTITEAFDELVKGIEWYNSLNK